jgi:predicted ATPase/transcriptional regulator with XRE-family HTH domain
MELPASFGVWLKERREQLGLTQAKLADCVGCSEITIRKIEADERRPSRQVAELLAGCLKITPEERPTFLKVARSELRVDRLGKVTPVSLHPSQDRASTLAVSQASSSLSAPRHNLPTPLTPLLGREHDLARIAGLLANSDCRLLTLVGPGGIGKTRLALEAAAKAVETFSDGVYFVSLAPLNTAEFMASAIAQALNLVLQGQASPTAQLLNYLRDIKRQALLVLDNFEHLLPATPAGDAQAISLVIDLLRQAPAVKLLVTSRERLNVQGEWAFEVQGLPAPPPDEFENLTTYSAVALFLHSARRSRAESEVTETEWPFVARICNLVEGLPLGVELAASWVRLLSCREIAQEIERSLDFLTISRGDAPARHSSLRVVFDYSWGLLSAEEQRVMRHLSLFRGGFEREAVEQVARTTLPVLSALMNKSLLRRNESQRYSLHELVRQYAQEQLHQPEERAEAHNRHLAYFAALAEEAERQLEGPEQVTWLERLEQEHDNLRAALGWAFEAPHERSEPVEVGLGLASALFRFWQGRGHLREGCAWLERGLQGDASARVKAKALNILGWLINQQGQHDLATALLQESLALYRELADAKGVAYALDSLGDAAWLQAEFQQAKAYYEESLALFRILDEAWMVGMSLCSLGRLHLDHGELEPAANLLEEGLTVLRPLADQRGIALSLLNLGRVSLGRGDYERAAGQVKESLALFQALGNKLDMADCFQVLASLARVRGQAGRTTRLWAVAGLVLESIGAPVLTTLSQAAYTEDMAFARRHLAEADLAVVWAEGRAMALDEAVAYALADQ